MANLVNTKAAEDTGVVLVYNNGAAEQTIVNKLRHEDMALIVQNTDALNDATVTVKAGTGTRSAIGDVAVVVAAGTSALIGPLDGMRFDHGKGIKVTVTDGTDATDPFAGTITDVKLAVVQL